jgi:L-rhamnose mutarotase
MDRSLYYVRLFPGTEERYDEIHRHVPGAVARGMRDAGLSKVSGFRRGTDVWWYAEAEPDRETAFSRTGKGVVNQRWGHQFRDVIAEIEAPEGGHIWYDEVFHTDGPALAGPSERVLVSLVIDPHKADRYDRLHVEPWPELLEALSAAGYRDYSGFRRGPHVVFVGDVHPDLDTASRRLADAEVTRRWMAELSDIITTPERPNRAGVRGSIIYRQD